MPAPPALQSWAEPWWGRAGPSRGLCLPLVAGFLGRWALSRQSPPPSVCFDRKRGAAGGRGERGTWASGRDSGDFRWAGRSRRLAQVTSGSDPCLLKDDFVPRVAPQHIAARFGGTWMTQLRVFTLVGEEKLPLKRTISQRRDVSFKNDWE